MECTAPKHLEPGTLSRFWEGVSEVACEGRCRGRELWLSSLTPGRCVLPGETWELDIWSRHLFCGEINTQGVPKVFSSSVPACKVRTVQLNTTSRIVLGVSGILPVLKSNLQHRDRLFLGYVWFLLLFRIFTDSSHLCLVFLCCFCSSPAVFTQQSFSPVLVLPHGSASSPGLVIRFSPGFLGLLSATPRAWSDLKTFTASFHCFLSGPSSKLSLPHDVCKPPDYALWAVAFGEYFLLFPCSSHICHLLPFSLMRCFHWRKDHIFVLEFCFFFFNLLSIHFDFVLPFLFAWPTRSFLASYYPTSSKISAKISKFCEFNKPPGSETWARHIVWIQQL